MATKTESVQVGMVNGVDVKALNGTIEAVKGNPAIAQATFAVESVLERGFQARAKTGPVTLGGGALAGRTKTFRFEGDHPPELLGQDQGPTAVETLLAALGAGVSGGVRAPRAELETLKEMAEGLSPVKDSLRAVAYTSELIVEN